MKTLIIGRGQVGTALFELLSGHYETYIRDTENMELEGVEVLHICYPEHAGFPETTKKYIAQYKPKLTIINSSVTVGTTDQCGEHVVYSPIRGRHPKLASDLKLYAKFVFGVNPEDCELAKQYFENCDLKVCTDNNPRAGELVKVLSNVHMGVEVAWRQEVERILKKFAIDPALYEMWESTYRAGYYASGDNHLMRPLMNPGPIGGHCILPCTDILNAQYPSPIFEFIKQSNEKAKGETK